MRQFGQIILDDEIDSGEGFDRAGYSRALGTYFYKRYIDSVNAYYRYYSITEEQYDSIKNGCISNHLTPEERFTAAKEYVIDENLVFCDSVRGYDIDRRFYIDHRDSICGDYLYEDGIVYMHLLFEGKHYAVIPLAHTNNPLRKRNGIILCCYIEDHEQIPICYGKRAEHIEED